MNLNDDDQIRILNYDGIVENKKPHLFDFLFIVSIERVFTIEI